MPQSWPGSSGGLAPKRGPGNFDRERPHCFLRSSATMDVASNWEQNSPAAPLYFLLFLFIHLLICGRLLTQPLCFIYLFTLFIHLFSYLRPWSPIDTAAPVRFTAAASPGRAAAPPGGRSGICPCSKRGQKKGYEENIIYSLVTEKPDNTTLGIAPREM